MAHFICCLTSSLAAADDDAAAVDHICLGTYRNFMDADAVVGASQAHCCASSALARFFVLEAGGLQTDPNSQTVTANCLLNSLDVHKRYCDDDIDYLN